MSLAQLMHEHGSSKMLLHKLSLYVALIAPFLSGCANYQLRCQTVTQANTLNELYEQQVLDNLAMFAVNHSAIPYFAFPNEGASNVDQKFGATGDKPLSPFFTTIGLSAEQGTTNSWVLSPVRSSDSISMMQLAYQTALGLPTDPCKSWCTELAAFRGADPTCIECDIHCGWVCVSDCRKDIPKCCGRRHGHYCGTYVWVKPGYEHEFSRLVLLILEFATKEPAKPKELAKKTVRFYIDKNGRATHPALAYGSVEANISIEDEVDKVLAPQAVRDLKNEKMLLEGRKETVNYSKNLKLNAKNLILQSGSALKAMDSTSFKDLDNAEKNKVNEEATQELNRRIQSLQSPTYEFYPSQESPASQSSGILELNQRQRALGNPFRER